MTDQHTPPEPDQPTKPDDGGASRWNDLAASDSINETKILP